MKFKKIVVTGGAGFIGSHVCEKLLDAGHHVISIDNFNDFYDPVIKQGNIEALQLHPYRNNFVSIKEDIRNLTEMIHIFQTASPDAVIHLAAMAGVRPSIQNPSLYTEINITGTQNILEACVKSGVKHMLFASSSSVYGNNQKVPFSETDQVDHPISPYAATKKAGELLCHVYTHLYQMSIDCLRFFTVYGPRQRPDLAIHKFCKLISDNEEIPFFGDGNSERDYTYIDDIVYGVMKALEQNLNQSGKHYEVINLGGSQTVSLTEMVSAIEEALHTKAILKLCAPQPGDVDRTFADIDKAGRILNYEPKMPFKLGIKKFVEWYHSIHQKEEVRLSA